MYGRSGGIAPHILKFGTRWRLVVSFTPPVTLTSGTGSCPHSASYTTRTGGSSFAGWSNRGMKLTTHLHYSYVFMAWCLVKHSDNFTCREESRKYWGTDSVPTDITRHTGKWFGIIRILRRENCTEIALSHRDPSGTKGSGGGGYTRVYPKLSGLSHNEIYAYNNKQSFRSNTKYYDAKPH
jgi:hypothetical protein